uniref:Ig-like domain-containing protein n=1 Tax=Astyanax mexicanus TaxID=7994 RepID=A0A3B1JZZ7_ASTMX
PDAPCFLLISSTGNGSAQSIKPLKDKMQVHADQTVTLSCKYSGNSYGDFLHWYRQYRGSRPEFLLMISASDQKHVIHATPKFERLDAEVNVTDNKVDLIISSTAVSDSALYYCALKQRAEWSSSSEQEFPVVVSHNCSHFREIHTNTQISIRALRA